MKVKSKTLKEQKVDAELGLIIDKMGLAMWNANKVHIATAESPLTLAMNDALILFKDHCMRRYGKKA